MSCVLLTILFIRDEYSFDSFHEKSAQLYRITTTNKRNGATSVTGATGQVQGPAFKANIPEVLEYVRVWQDIAINVIGDQKSLAVSVTYADDNYFKVFSYPLLHGSSANALTEMNSIVLSEETALKFFGSTDVVGKTLKVEEGRGIEVFLVTGVAKKIPHNSSLKFDAVLPFRYLQTMFNDSDWLNSYVSTFVLLHPHANLQKVEEAFSRVFQNEAGAQLKTAGLDQTAVQYGLQPIANVHLGISGEGGKSAKLEGGGLANQSVYTYSYLLGGIALFILVMACVNFLNLSIAGFMERSKEVGVRKISGGTRSQIVSQFLGESAIIGCISYLLSIGLVLPGLPLFNRLAQKNMHFSFPYDLIFFFLGLVLLVICVLLVGLYPAIKLAFFDLVRVLSNKQKWSGKNYLGKSLIVLQFAMAMGLLFSCIIYYRQMNFISNRDLGYNPTDVIEVQMPPGRSDERVVNLFKNELITAPSIKYVTRGSLYEYESRDINVNGNAFRVPRFFIDEFYLPALEISLKEGRNFSTLLRSDSNAVIVNEEFVKQAGLSKPLLQKIKIADEPQKTVIGVVRDFNTQSLKSKVRPQVLELKHVSAIFVKAQKGKTVEALAAMENTFRKLFPDHYYQIAFLDDIVGNHYVNEKRWKQIITFATGLAIIVCCIGLFGLAHFATVKRTKEIGIRKVLGASTFNVLQLISDEFMKLVILAVVIISPVVWYFMNSWLQDFSYRININWLDITITILIAFLIALITVGAQVIRTALQSPVRNLRTE
jgi:putative ABC transport system permease protein